MATPFSSLITSSRRHLLETTASFWSDAELLDIAIKGVTDLWASAVKLNEEHFLTIDTSSVTLPASATQLTGVPADVHSVYLIEPADTSDTAASRDVVFVPRDYNHPHFSSARSQGAVDISTPTAIYYAVVNGGSPVAAPTVLTAPKISAALALRFVYIPTLPVSTYTTASNNPIPGESDQALINWIVAYARAKERDDRSPDPNWISTYIAEKQSILSRLAPRQLQEPKYVDAVYELYWS